MPNLPSAALTRTAERARAAAIVARVLPLTNVQSMTLVETVDAVCAAILRTAELDDPTIRAVLAALFEHQMPTAASSQPEHRLRLTDRDREMLRDLGGRIHAIRTARQLSEHLIARETGIPPERLRDLERGVAAPTVLALHRLAHELQVSLPMLLDTTLSPLELLATLARRARATRVDPPADEQSTGDLPEGGR